MSRFAQDMPGLCLVSELCYSLYPLLVFPGGLDGKESAYNAEDLGLMPGSGRSPGEGNGNPLQYSCLKNPMNRGAWQITVSEITELNTTEQLALSHQLSFSKMFQYG